MESIQTYRTPNHFARYNVLPPFLVMFRLLPLKFKAVMHYGLPHTQGMAW